MNTMLDEGYPRGALNYWKSRFLPDLSDDAIRTMVDCYTGCPAPMSKLLLEHFHGAVTRVGVTDTAFPHRAPGYNFLVLGQWADRKDNDACIRLDARFLQRDDAVSTGTGLCQLPRR